MQKKIVALYNSSNQGKTSTLRKLSILLNEKYSSQLQNYELHETKNSGSDFIMVFKLYGLNFSIISEGDIGTIVKKHLDKFSYSDVIICTTRTKGSTVDVVKAFQKEHQAKLIWFSSYAVDHRLKKYSEFLDQANSLNASHLWKLLEDSISFDKEV